MTRQLDQRDKLVAFFNLARTFPDYAKYVGIRSTRLAGQALVNGNQFTVLQKRDEAFVKAWVAWTMTFEIQRMVVWIKPDWRHDSPLLDIQRFLTVNDDVASNLDVTPSQITEHHTQSNVKMLIPSPHTGTGLTITHLIVEGVGHETPVWKDLMNQLLPVMPHDKRVVTIV